MSKQYTKANFKTAAPIADNGDIHYLNNVGVKVMSELANKGDIGMQASIQRLVNSGLLAEGRYL